MSSAGILVVFGMIICGISSGLRFADSSSFTHLWSSDPGFNMVINANGFAPNSNVNWKLVNSEAQIPLYAYFQTNGTGGFNDVTFADDLKADRYKMYLVLMQTTTTNSM